MQQGECLMKFKHMFAELLSILLIFTSCSTEQGEANKETETINITTASTNAYIGINRAADTFTSANTKIYSPNIQELAHIYTVSILEKLEHSKGKFDFMPVSMNSDNMIELQSILILLDIDFDGIPELFAGCSSTIGAATYEVFKSDGSSMGEAFCCSGLDMRVNINGVIYVFSGRNPYPGWVKLVDGLPSIYLTDFINKDGKNDVDLTTAEGEKKILNDLSLDEVKEVYTEYLGVDYDELYNQNYSDDIKIDGYLRVPDPENYTEEDIYNCLVKLLAQYEELKVQ